MALQSMTGFARATGSHEGIGIAWELKSVNGKGLDIRLRLPPGSERIEPQARRAAQQRFKRGNVQAVLTLNASGLETLPVVNHALLAQLAELSRDLVERTGCAPASADGLLGLRGVLVAPDSDLDDEAARQGDAAILAVFEEALDDLRDARTSEGKALSEVLTVAIDSIEGLTRSAETDTSRSPESIRQRLAEQVAQLMDNTADLDEGRLHMEAALLASKADIREEIDRLNTHIASARSLLEGGGAVGRRLDFLAQEFNRETNTICSKSNAASLTKIGLELKAVVDQFREQLQNLE